METGEDQGAQLQEGQTPTNIHLLKVETFWEMGLSPPGPHFNLSLGPAQRTSRSRSRHNYHAGSRIVGTPGRGIARAHLRVRTRGETWTKPAAVQRALTELCGRHWTVLLQGTGFISSKKARVCRITGPPPPQSRVKEQQQWPLREEPQKRTSARWYFPREYPTWQRLRLEDHPSQKCCLCIALAGFLPITLSLYFIQRMVNSPHRYDKAPGRVGDRGRRDTWANFKGFASFEHLTHT